MDLLHSLVLDTCTGLFFLTIAILIERIAPIECYSMRARIPGILMNVTSDVTGIFLIWPAKHLWYSLGISWTIPLWQYLMPLGLAGYVLQFLILIIIADFLAYWRHRMEHSRWWWPVHKVHHAPAELHAANDIGHPVQAIFSLLWITIPMSAFQIDGPGTPWAIGLVVGFLAVYIHCPIDFHFGPLRRLIVDNRFHRIHHSLEPRHVDKNFGICLSVWDQLFGTAYFPAPNEWPKVGVVDVQAPRTVGEFLMLPIVALPTGVAGGARI